MIKQVIAKIKEAEFLAKKSKDEAKKDAHDLFLLAKKDFENEFFAEIESAKLEMEKKISLAEKTVKEQRLSAAFKVQGEARRLKDLAFKNENEAILQILKLISKSD